MDWLTQAALPLWLDKGFDRKFGGFHDKLDLLGVPLELPKRCRVQARQIFVFCEAARLQWDGPWREAVEGGLQFMFAHYRRDDGLFRTSVTAVGEVVDDEPDLYDQAFVLFALAAAYHRTGRPAALLDEANALLDTLEKLLAHPLGGFYEAGSKTAPLRSNPHMHLLEALLSWVSVGGGGRFVAKAQEIVDLALARFLDPTTGAVGEYFDSDWTFAADPTGGVREPGHQFEWAYLFREARITIGGSQGVAAAGLLDFGSKHGIVDGRAIFSVDASGRPLDMSSRLWAQTERLRATLLSSSDDVEDADRAAAESFMWIQRHLDVPIRGLWRERVDASGRWIEEACPASSLYHILTGFGPLLS